MVSVSIIDRGDADTVNYVKSYWEKLSRRNHLDEINRAKLTRQKQTK